MQSEQITAAHPRRSIDPVDRRAAPRRPPTSATLPPAAVPASLIELQRTAGNLAVQRLVRLARPPAPARQLTRAEQRTFVRTELTGAGQRAEGLRVIQDMGETSDVMDFSSPAELRTELIKRVTMTQLMQSSQESAGGLAGFGYPFTAPSLYWGPRVNFAAKDYWLPAVPDGYDQRRDRAKRAELRLKTRRERHAVFGDQPPGYRFVLSPAGHADPYEAILRLFDRQTAHKRTLIHCDYLISLVHFRALMATTGKAAFNSRIAAYGPANIVLRALLFTELEPVVRSGSSTRPGLNSIRQVIPASPADLVLGDHVYFWNHPAYDVINRTIGNAWRLENALLVSRRGGTDVFLGHGSGRKTHAMMRSKLAEEYNEVDDQGARHRPAHPSRIGCRARGGSCRNVHQVPGSRRGRRHLADPWHRHAQRRGGHSARAVAGI